MKIKLLAISLFTLLISASSTFAQSAFDEPPVSDSEFWRIQSLQAGDSNAGYWDQPGVNPGFVSGASILVYANDGGRDQQFRFMPAGNGYYNIICVNGGAVTVAGGKDGDGVPLQTNRQQGSNAEKFRFRHLGGGRWKIYSITGRAVCLGNRSHANGTAVHTWGDHDGAWMEWRIVSAETGQPYFPAASASAVHASGEIYKLAAGEEMVFGKIGTDDESDVRYTFAVVRKPNPTKTVYNKEIPLPYGGSDPILGGRRSVVKNPEKHDLYDFWIVFNGKKYGPYDRIYEMGLKYSEIDKWVSADGKSIRFMAAVGDRYELYLGGERLPLALGSIAVDRIFSSLPEKKVMAVKRGSGNWDLFENGQTRLKGWNYINWNMTFSDDGTQLLYAAGEKTMKEQSVYLNHEKIAGPFGSVGKIGFIPGTSITYFYASSVGDDPSRTKKGFYVGDEFLDVMPVDICFRKNSMVFSGCSKSSGNFYAIYEYDYTAKKLKKSGSYTNLSVPWLSDSWAYYSANNAGGDSVLVRQDGTVVAAVKKAQYREGNVFFHVAPNDDIYTFYSTKPMGPLTALKNGKTFAPAAGAFTGCSVSFDKDTGKMMMKLFGGKQPERIIYGDRSFDASDLCRKPIFAYAPSSGDVFNVRQTGKEIYTSKLMLYKNAEPLSDRQWAAVSEIAASPDGTRYAALVVENLVNPSATVKYSYYWTENDLMDSRRQLIVNGQMLGTGCGLPVWSAKKNKFIFLKAENGVIKISEF